MANLLFATRESDSLRSENPGMSQPSRGLVLISWMALCRTAATSESPGREATRLGTNFLPHQDPIIRSGDAAATSSALTIRPCAPGDLDFPLNTSWPPAI